MSFLQLQHAPWRLLSAAASWHVTSQQHARRNALVASTALIARREERLDVEEFLAAHAARPAGAPVSSPSGEPAPALPA
jgi:hypothetical protein